MWRYCEKNSDVIWYCESQCERNSSHNVTHIVRRLWENCEWRWIPLIWIWKNRGDLKKKIFFEYFYVKRHTVRGYCVFKCFIQTSTLCALYLLTYVIKNSWNRGIAHSGLILQKRTGNGNSPTSTVLKCHFRTVERSRDLSTVLKWHFSTVEVANFIE